MTNKTAKKLLIPLHSWVTLLLFCCLMMPSTAAAAPRNFTERYSTNINGDLYLIGNTSMTCDTVGTATNAANCANARAITGGLAGNDLNNNNYNMVFVDQAGAMYRSGNTTYPTSAVLNMPAGSTIVWAGLYWGAESSNAARNQVTFSTPASTSTVTSAVVDFIDNNGCNNTCARYGAFTDVTSLVQSAGNGTYRVSNIQAWRNNATGGAAVGSTYAGWSLVVIFENSSLPLRNLSVFDGFVSIACGYPNTVNIPISGFLTPYSGPVQTTLGAIAGEGDLGSTGDNLQLNGTNLVDPVRQTGNFFNTSISNLGSRTATNNPSYANQLGWDIARINASGILPNAATSANITVTTSAECYYPSTVTFATDLYVPVIVPNVSKVGVDVNGGNLVPGDILRYTIAMNNTGYDSGTNLSVIDNIPAFTSYVPGSLKVVTGPPLAPTGPMTDASADDIAEYIATGTPRVVFRLGSGATAVNGGSLALGQSTSLSFDVQLDSTIPAGTILTNQAQISYSGQTLGAVYAAASSAAASAVFVPPNATKTFTPPVVANSATPTTLSIVFTNPAASLGAVTGVTVTDTYPAGLINATPANPSLTCTAGSTPGSIVGGVAGGNTIGMTGTTIAQNGSCTLSVSVKGTGDGIFTNNLGQITTSNAGNSPTPSATATFSVGRPGIAKAFSAASILTGNNATLTFTLTNPTAVVMTGATFTDTYPAGLVNVTPLAPGGTCAGRTVDAATVAGSGVFNLTGATIPANNVSCTVTVAVTSASGGSYANTTSGVTTAQTPTVGAASNTANLLVYAPLTATKAFTPSSISSSGTSQLAITITNPNPAGMSAVTAASLFTDTYPGSLFNTAAPNPVITCTAGSSGTLAAGTGAAGGNTIGIGAATIASGGSCTISVFVTSAAVNTYTDNADTINTNNAGTGTIPAATLNVSSLTPPGATKSFTGPIARNQASVMTITLTNSNGAPITGAAFTDSYPAGLINTATPNEVTTCVGGTVVTVAGGNSLALSGATIPASGSCTVTVNVTSATPDTYYNNTGLINTGNAGVGTGANNNLQVLAPPTVTKAFATNPIAASATTTLTLTLTNPIENTVALTGVSLLDTYPAGMTNAAAANGATTCSGGSVTAANNGPSVALSGASIPVGGSCTITVSIKAPAASGEYTNTILAADITTTNAGTALNDVTAKLSVGEPGISKSFAPSPILAGGTSVLTITLSNPTAVAMTAAAFTDTYPVGMTNTAAAAAATTCVGGAVTAANNGPSVALSGGTIPANGSCRVTVNVTATATTINTIDAGSLTVSGGASNANPATATLNVTPPPQITKSFSPATIPTSGAYSAANGSVLTIVVSNPTSNTINGVAFTDLYTAALISGAHLLNGAAPSVVATAGSTCNVTGVSGGNTVGLANTSILLGNGSCTITVPVYASTAAPASVPGTYTNRTSSVTSTNGGTGPLASADITVLSPFTGTKAFAPTTVNTNDDSTITITLINPNSTPITGISLTDLLPPNLVFSGTPVVTATCGGSTSYINGVPPGTYSLSITGGTIPANSNCIITTSVTPTTVASPKTNGAITVSSSNAGQATIAAANLVISAGLPPTISKAYSASQINVNGTSTLTITLRGNTASTCAAGGGSTVNFSDVLPAGLNFAAAPAPTSTCLTNGGVNGTPTLAGGAPATTLNYTINSLLAAGVCTITATVTGTAPGTFTNTINTVTTSNNDCGTGGPSNSLPLTVVLQPPTVTKSFSPDAIPLGGSSTMTIILTNPVANGANDITGVNFSDTFPTVIGPPAGQMVVATPLTNYANSCGGSATAVAGGTSLTLTNGTVPSSVSRSCAVTVDVSSAAKGSYLNSTGPINSNNTPPQTTPGSATLTAYTDAALTVVKTADKGTAKPGDIITYTLQFVNTGDVDASNISVSDVLSPYIAFGTNSYPAAPVPPGPAFDLSGSGSLPTPNNPQYFNSSNASITPSGSFDSAVAKWTIPFTGTLGGGNSLTIRYKTQVK